MQAKSVFLVALFLIQSCYSQLYTCQDKSLFEEGSYKLKAADGDVNFAYNEVESCTSLVTTETTDEDKYFCCYTKLKIKNKKLDQKFTQKGCVELTLEEIINPNRKFKDFKKDIEGYIEGNNTNHDIEVKKLDIDCSAKFLHIVGISLLLFLL